MGRQPLQGAGTPDAAGRPGSDRLRMPDPAVPDPAVPVAAGTVAAPTEFGVGRWRRGPLFASIWLIYLVDTLRDIWREPNLALRALGVLALFAFVVLYVLSWSQLRSHRHRLAPVPPRTQLLIVGGGLLCTLAAVPAAGQSSTAMVVFLTVLVMFALPPRWSVLAVLLLAGAVELSSRTVPGWKPADQLGFQIVVTAIAMYGVGQLVVRNRQLALAQEELARLAVAQERSRFARDLHDILGHSLTVLTVKAELAGRLVRLDPDRAEDEITQVERLAREALADVRAAVSGYRETSLPTELVSARVALDAAGIEAELPNAVDEVPGERRELVGWALREAVTNVVRHSGARHCRVRVDRHGIEVSDDGRGPAGPGDGRGPADGSAPGRGSADGRADRVPDGAGHGLKGLRERAQRAGAALTVGRSPEGGFLVRVTW